MVYVPVRAFGFLLPVFASSSLCIVLHLFSTSYTVFLFFFFNTLGTEERVTDPC